MEFGIYANASRSISIVGFLQDAIECELDNLIVPMRENI